MKCQKCNSNFKKLNVSIEGIKNKVLSYQCQNCDNFSFDKESSSIVLNELNLIKNYFKEGTET